MMLDVGPVAPASARAWIDWAHGISGELDEVQPYLEQWTPCACTSDTTFRWCADVDPDELEYLVQAFVSLDTGLWAEVQRGEGTDVPDEGRDFHLVLVRALLHALESEGPVRAQFADQLRWSWPSAAEAS